MCKTYKGNLTRTIYTLCVGVLIGAHIIRCYALPPCDRCYFSNHLSMLEQQIQGTFTNSFEIFVHKAGDLRFQSTNFLSNLLGEVFSDSFKGTVSEMDQTTQVLQFRVSICVDSDGAWILTVVDSTLCDIRLYERFRKRFRFYIQERIAGHTTKYVESAINEYKSRASASPISSKDLQSRYWIPSNWIKRVDSERGSIVVDGPYAWYYDDSGASERRDAKEYDPKLKGKFSEARRILAESKSDHGQGLLNSSYTYDLKLKRVLKEKFDIDWLTPAELE